MSMSTEEKPTASLFMSVKVVERETSKRQAETLIGIGL